MKNENFSLPISKGKVLPKGKIERFYQLAHNLAKGFYSHPQVRVIFYYYFMIYVYPSFLHLAKGF